MKARDYKGLNHEAVRDGAAIIDNPQAFRMTAIGEYADDDTGSTLKACDHKEPKDLVVPQAFNWQEGDAEYSLRDDSSALAADSRPAVLMTMREVKPGGGKGPLMVEEESLTLATGNGQTLFQPQAFDEMNFTTDDETHHVLRAGTKQSTGVLEPYGFSAGNSQHARSMGEEQGVAPPIRAGASGTNQSPTVGPVAYRKSRRPQSATDDETWVDDGQANTLNVFDVGDTRTTHAIVEPTAFTQNQREEVRDLGDQTAALAANTGMHQTNYISHYGVRRLTPVECERLQAFPDGWTEPAGSDSARYKALGNAVTVNTVGWILRRMVNL